MRTIESKIEELLEEATAKRAAKEEPEASKLKTAGAVAAGGALAAKKLGLLKTLALAGKSAAALKGGAGATYVDPSLSRSEAAKNSAIASGLGTALVNSPAAIFGGVPGGALAIASGMAAAKGGVLGAALGGGRDTLLKSAAIPAAVVAAAAPLTNMAFDAADYHTHINPAISAAITGGVGLGAWALRNSSKKNRQYI